MLDVNATWRYAPLESWKGAARRGRPAQLRRRRRDAAPRRRREVHAAPLDDVAPGLRPHDRRTAHPQDAGAPRQAGDLLLSRSGPPSTGRAAWRRSSRPATRSPFTATPTSRRATTRRSEQRDEMETGLAALDKFGVKPVRLPRPDVVRRPSTRWRSSASYGMRYDSSLIDDDRPYLLDTPTGRIAEMCPSSGISTTGSSTSTCPTPTSVTRSTGPASSRSSGSRSSRRMRETGSLLMLTCHPFASGRPGRIKAIEKTDRLRRLVRRRDVRRAGRVAQRLLAVRTLSRSLNDPTTAIRGTQANVPTRGETRGSGAGQEGAPLGAT